jgi:DNA polymerase delta subunit 3
MTMETSQALVDYIAQEVFKNEKPVTYRTLSRGLGIHIDVAKQILNEFYTNNESKLHGTSIVTGIKSGKQTVQLIKNDTLVEEKQKYSEVANVHIYSINVNKFELTHQDLALQEQKVTVNFADAEKYYKNGMLKGPPVETVDVPVFQSTPEPKTIDKGKTTSQTAPKSSVSNTSHTKPVKSAGLTSRYVSRKSEQKDSSKEIPSKRSSTKPSGYVYKSRKLQSSQPKERVIISHDDDDQVMEDVEVANKLVNTAELEKLFDSDFSDFEVDNSQPKAEGKHEKPGEIAQEERGAQPVHQDEDIEMEEPQPEELQPKEPQPEEPQTVQTIDDDGYITTARKKTVTKPEARKATRPTLKAKTAPSDGKKKQTSLMNFFQKK